MEERGRRATEDVTQEAEVGVMQSPALMLKEGATSPGVQVALRIWKRQGNRSFPRASRRKQPC